MNPKWIDGDASGEIEKEELADVLKDKLGKENARMHVDQLFLLMDKDQSGIVHL